MSGLTKTAGLSYLLLYPVNYYKTCNAGLGKLQNEEKKTRSDHCHANSFHLTDLLQTTCQRPYSSRAASCHTGSQKIVSVALCWPTAGAHCTVPRLVLQVPREKCKRHKRMSTVFQTHLHIPIFYTGTVSNHCNTVLKRKKKTKNQLTNTPFISLKTTPLKVKGVWGSFGFSCSSRHPSCLNNGKQLHNDSDSNTKA